MDEILSLYSIHALDVITLVILAIQVCASRLLFHRPGLPPELMNRIDALFADLEMPKPTAKESRAS